ncbi:MAG: DUF3307 domain-containing protein [Elusimicrobia bacterium]|nr:DUF3307 domain-containing protein [Elusimicrobiota bacterium]
MIIFWRLVLGHFLADFTLQTNRINAWKRSSAMGMMIHCLIHPICYLSLIYPYLGSVWITLRGIPIHGITAVGLIALLHYIEDAWRVAVISKHRNLDTTLYLIWDQVIHLSVIFIFFGETPGDSGLIIPELWPVILILTIIATHFSVVLIYFIEKDLYGKPYPNDTEKYVAIAERGLAFAGILTIPSVHLALAVVLTALTMPRIIMATRFKPNELGLPPNFSWAFGAVIAVAAGLLGRLLLA